jgi:hypothetical protein
MAMNLFKASAQWSTRPADERFWNLSEMLDATSSYRMSAKTAKVASKDLRVEAVGSDMRLVGRAGTPATLTHFAFGQLASRAKAPAGYLRELPPTLAAQNLNHGLARAEDSEVALLLHQNGSLVCRAALSDSYSRVWNNDIVRRLTDLTAQGWKNPAARPAGVAGERTRIATADDVSQRKGLGGLSVKIGDTIAPAGLYASDKDMFAFLVNEETTIDDGSEDGLARGFFVWNSEVGDCSFGVSTFLYKHVCGNHIVWGAKDVAEIRVRHVGEANARVFQSIAVEMRKYADSAVSDTESQIGAAKRVQLGATKDEAIDAVLAFATKRKIAPLTRAKVTEAYQVAAQTDRYGSPRTVWGMVNGLTEVSQRSGFTDDRTKLDRAAGKVMEMAF